MSISETVSQREDTTEREMHFRQGSIDEFLALRPPTKNPNTHTPCIPVQYKPRRNKRSSQFKRKMLYPLYPVNVYQQNPNHIAPMSNHAKPPNNNVIYNAYGGYHCAPYKSPQSIKQPVHNNFLAHLLGGTSGTNTNVRPVNEQNRYLLG